MNQILLLDPTELNFSESCLLLF